MEKTVVEAFGQAVRSLRREKGLTQEKLALQSGIQRKYLGAIELGHKQPSLNTVLKLAHGLSLSASELVAYMETLLQER